MDAAPPRSVSDPEKVAVVVLMFVAECVVTATVVSVFVVGSPYESSPYPPAPYPSELANTSSLATAGIMTVPSVVPTAFRQNLQLRYSFSVARSCMFLFLSVLVVSFRIIAVSSDHLLFNHLSYLVGVPGVKYNVG